MKTAYMMMVLAEVFWLGEKKPGFDDFTNAMQLFQKRNIDAFMHLGDAAHRGKNVEVQYHRDIFEKCFPHGKAKDGRTVEKLLVVGNHDSRVFAYDVVIVGDNPKARLFKSVYFEGCNVAPGHEPNNGITEVGIPIAELPAGKKLIIAVRPVSSLGTKGKAIGATYKV